MPNEFGFEYVGTGADDPVTSDELAGDEWRPPRWPHPTSQMARAIDVDANRWGEEPWRLDRLQSVLGWLEAHGDFGTLVRMDSVYDHKGLLTVTWKILPGPKDVEAVEDAWSDHYECLVEHRGPEGDLLFPDDPVTWAEN